MKKLLYLLIILYHPDLYSQDSKPKPNLVFVQLGMGRLASDGPESILNLDFAFERTFIIKNHWRIGAQIDFGYWSDGSLYSDQRESGYQIMLSGTVKYRLGKSNRHFAGVDGGYAFFHGNAIESEAQIEKNFHVPTAALTYQYYSAKDFYGRAGIGIWQGLLLGIGVKF